MVNFVKSVLEIDDFERPFKRWIEARGWLYEKVTSASRNGWPDRFLARRGMVILLEWKGPNKEPNRQQLLRHAELRAKGLSVVWFNDIDRAKAYFISFDR